MNTTRTQITILKYSTAVAFHVSIIILCSCFTKINICYYYYYIFSIIRPYIGLNKLFSFEIRINVKCTTRLT